ncbi:MAG: glycosyltransferase [Flavobacteriaceae bacterium]|nr:glycosyltransferase [Flavobacteriaceae bacterium]
MKTTLLISTYNWVEALELVMDSALSQSRLPDEILIADDGSDDTTKSFIEEFRKKCEIPMQHIWQEDLGFRKAKILNKAIAKSNSEYIIQVDGDCIIHKNFIKNHLNEAQKGLYLYGSRVNILPDFVDSIFLKKKIIFNFFSKEIKNRTRAIHIPFLSKFYKKTNRISNKFRGCNVSYWREDFISINGYNEDFEGWGREDSDLVIRLSNNGVKAKRIRYAAIVFHIHHKIKSKQNFDLNDKMQNKTVENNTVRISNGINQYL